MREPGPGVPSLVELHGDGIDGIVRVKGNHRASGDSNDPWVACKFV